MSSYHPPMKPSVGSERGFTLIELMVVVTIIGILVSVATASYYGYLDRARRTVSISALETMRKMIEVYAIDHGSFPLSIDFSTCVDQNSNPIMPAIICDQIKSDLFSIDSYTLTNNVYTVMSKALDRNRSQLRMTGDSIVVVAP